MPLTTFAIGALHWINAHPKSAVSFNIQEIAFSSTDTFQDEFCEKTSISPEAVTARVAFSKGTTRPKNCVNGVVAIGEGQTPLTFCRVKRGWAELSQTVPMGKEDEALRYNTGPDSGHRACAVDVAVFLGIQLNVGRIIRDVVTPDYLGRLPVPVRVFWWVIASPWGVMTQIQRNEARDVVAQTLAAVDPSTFPLGEFRSVQTVVETLTDHTPQLSWTEAGTYMCCDAVAHASSDNDWTRVRSSISVGGWNATSDTLEKSIQAYFTRQVDLPEGSLPCTKKEHCSRRQRKRVHTLLDGSGPARLIVHLTRQASVTWKQAKQDRRHIFDNIHLRFFSTSDEFTTKYQVIGAIFMTGEDHFVARWKDASQSSDALSIRHYDGGRQDGQCCKTVPTWWAGYDIKGAPPSRVITCIYECII